MQIYTGGVHVLHVPHDAAAVLAPVSYTHLDVYKRQSAYSVKHLARAALAVVGSTFAGIAAGFAALRLIGEAFFSKKLLLVGGEGEFLSAIFADDRFVLAHVVPL